MKKIIALILAVLVLISFSASATYKSAADGIVSWGKNGNNYVLSDEILMTAGSAVGDWFPIALGRYGIKDNFEGYLAVIGEYITEKYKTKNKLHSSKATEWHRIGLAVLAAGGNPENIGMDENGNGVNLIKDGTYDRGKTVSLGRQGINGWIWALILLDSMDYPIPQGAYYSRSDIITEIISAQLESGGFALSGKEADPDITAMAVQALAPYYNSETEYTYTRNGETATNSVADVIDAAISVLSAMQTDEGDYKSWGMENAESVSQVLIAVCTLGIDPKTDSRFIKNGKTLIDGIMKYQTADGGFMHSFTADSRNPEAVPGQSNKMTSQQVLCALTAYDRFVNGKRDFYDFRSEQSGDLKRKIDLLETKIDSINADTSENELRKLSEMYAQIPTGEQRYVKNYRRLLKLLKQKPKPVENETKTKIAPETEETRVVFSEEDFSLYRAIPQTVTTKEYVTVVTLLEKAEKADDFEGKAEIIQKLKSDKEKIQGIKTEIDNINAEIKEKLYPFEKLTASDYSAVRKIKARINALSEYDKSKIQCLDDVEKSVVQTDNLLRALIISGIMIVLILLLAVILILRIRKRRKKKRCGEYEGTE